MNKNVLLVLVVILTPIIILGVLAISGAENFQEQKEAAQHEEESQTEAAPGTTSSESVGMISLPLWVSSFANQCSAV